MSLSISAVLPSRGSLSRSSSSGSSTGSSVDSSPPPPPPPLPRLSRSKRRVIQLSFPYAPASVSDPYIITSEAEPLKTMPICLVPNDSMRQLPPILHLGWSIDEGRLLEWCSSEGFHRTTTDINGHHVFDYPGTVAGALHYFAQRSGAGMFEPYIQLTSHRGEPVIVAITSNYLLSDELEGRTMDIHALGSLLQREGLLHRDSKAARWYIDFKQWRWVNNKPK